MTNRGTDPVVNSFCDFEHVGSRLPVIAFSNMTAFLGYGYGLAYRIINQIESYGVIAHLNGHDSAKRSVVLSLWLFIHLSMPLICHPAAQATLLPLRGLEPPLDLCLSLVVFELELEFSAPPSMVPRCWLTSVFAGLTSSGFSEAWGSKEVSNRCNKGVHFNICLKRWAGVISQGPPHH